MAGLSPLPYEAPTAHRANAEAAAVPTLSAEQFAQLAVSGVGSTRIRRAAAVARFDGIMLALFGVLTVAFGLTSITAIAIGLVIGVVGVVEMVGANQLRNLQPHAPPLLGINQLVLAAALIIYSLVQIARTAASPGTNLFADITDPDLQQMLQPYAALAKQLTYAVYGGVIAIAICVQGSLAWYYFSRRKHLLAYLAATPAWVTQVRQAVER